MKQETALGNVLIRGLFTCSRIFKAGADAAIHIDLVVLVVMFSMQRQSLSLTCQASQ